MDKNRKRRVGARPFKANDGGKPNLSRELASQDKRFAPTLDNPVFRTVPKHQKMVTIDKRFQPMFHSESFKVKYTIDKRGRPMNTSTDDNLRKYYKLEDEVEDDDAVEIKSEEESDTERVEIKSEDDDEMKTEIKEEIIEENESNPELDTVLVTSNTSNKVKLSDKVRKKLCSAEVDYARGEGLIESSDDESSDADESSASEDDEVEHEWGEMDKDAERTEEATSRLALCNMDWDRIKASDLMLLFNSFLPPGGVLYKVSIYQSEFGKQRMELEEQQGPLELQQFKEEHCSDDEYQEKDPDASDNEEGDEYHREKLRKYQLNRLKYFYAVLEFDRAATADKVYNECDGMEYESSAAKIDLRFIPDNITFDETPTETCDTVPEGSKYRPKFFTTTALQQVKVACTWDETDPTRKEIIGKALDKKENVDHDDLKAYLASSSSDSEDEVQADDKNLEKASSESDPIAKYRMLLEHIEKKDEEKNKDVELEITWGVGLKQKAEELVKKKSKEAEAKGLTPWEEQLAKQKDKRRAKKAGKTVDKQYQNDSEDSGDSEGEQQLFSDDDVDVDMNDPFFKDGLNQVKRNGSRNKKVQENVTTEEDKTKAAELDLLLFEDDEKKNHFNFKKIIQSETETKSKRKRKEKKLKRKPETNNEIGNEDGFEVDVEDQRFSALFTSHHFNIDPSEPNFKKTKAMDTIIKAKQTKRFQISREEHVEVQSSKGADQAPEQRKKAEIAFLVNSIKNKSKIAAKEHRRQTRR